MVSSYLLREVAVSIMPTSLAIALAGPEDARVIAASSRASLDRPLRCAAELSLAIVSDDAVLVGAFQRAKGLRRGSGGPEVRVGPGTVHVALALAHPAALIACDEKRIVNRYVRPLLRALTKAGGTHAAAHYFGRDWISIAHRPVAWVGFAHDSTTRRTLFEAFVAVRTPFALTERASFLGKPHGTLEALAGTAVDEGRLVQAIADAYSGGLGAIPLDWPDAPSPEGDAPAEPPWAAVVDEAIGPIGAGLDAHGVFRVGGDLLVSRDALSRLEALAATAPEDELAHIVDETLGSPGAALDGVRSLVSVRDVILAARRLYGNRT
jgi:hypothetical protein